MEASKQPTTIIKRKLHTTCAFGFYSLLLGMVMFLIVCSYDLGKRDGFREAKEYQETVKLSESGRYLIITVPSSIRSIEKKD